MFKFSKLEDKQVFGLKKDIADIKAHEEKTIVLLGDAVPMVLNHVWGNTSVELLNDLIRALSPVNRNAVISFMKEFQAHEYTSSAKDKRVKLFGKRIGDNKNARANYAKAQRAKAEKFFSRNPETDAIDPTNGYYDGDYWAWAEHKKAGEVKEVNYFDQLGDVIDKLLDEKKGGATETDIIKYLMNDKGLPIQNILTMLAEAGKNAA